MEARVSRLESGFEEIRAAVARIEQGQTKLGDGLAKLTEELRDLRRDMKEQEFPGLRAQLAGPEAGLREKPSGKDVLALAQSMNGALPRAFGLALGLLAAGAGGLAFLHRQGVL